MNCGVPTKGSVSFLLTVQFQHFVLRVSHCLRENTLHANVQSLFPGMQRLSLRTRGSIPPLSESNTKNQDVTGAERDPLCFSTRFQIAGRDRMGGPWVVRQRFRAVVGVKPDQIQENSTTDDSVLCPIYGVESVMVVLVVSGLYDLRGADNERRRCAL